MAKFCSIENYILFGSHSLTIVPAESKILKSLQLPWIVSFRRERCGYHKYCHKSRRLWSFFLSEIELNRSETTVLVCLSSNSLSKDQAQPREKNLADLTKGFAFSIHQISRDKNRAVSSFSLFFMNLFHKLTSFRLKGERRNSSSISNIKDLSRLLNLILFKHSNSPLLCNLLLCVVRCCCCCCLLTKNTLNRDMWAEDLDES